jgi:hypothetical protein
VKRINGTPDTDPRFRATYDRLERASPVAVDASLVPTRNPKDRLALCLVPLDSRERRLSLCLLPGQRVAASGFLRPLDRLWRSGGGGAFVLVRPPETCGY